MHKIITILILFCFVFGIPFYNIPLNSSKLTVIFLIICYLVKKIRCKDISFKFNKDTLFLSFWIIVSIVLSLLSNILNGTNDFYIAYSFLLMLIETLLGSYLLYILFLKRYDFYNILNFFIIVALLQSAIILGMFVSEFFREFIYSIANLNAEQLMQRYGGFRGFGLAGSVTYDLAFFISIPLMFISYLLSQSKKNKAYYISAWVFMVFAILMTGRTGWIGIAFSLLILFYNFKSRNTFNSIVKFISILFILISISLMVLENYYPEVYDVLFDSVVPYAFEMFINFYETGSFSAHSMEILEDMYFLPPLKTLIIGDGYFKDPFGYGYYMHVDAGYLRMVLFYGVFASLVLYSMYIYIFLKIHFKTKIYKNFNIVVLMLCLYYFIVQWKGVIMSNSGMNIKLVFIIFIYVVYSMKELKAKGIRR